MSNQLDKENGLPIQWELGLHPIMQNKLVADFSQVQQMTCPFSSYDFSLKILFYRSTTTKETF
jgi:hypothetical protein